MIAGVAYVMDILTWGFSRNVLLLAHPPQWFLFHSPSTISSFHVLDVEKKEVLIMWQMSMLVKYRQKSSNDILQDILLFCKTGTQYWINLTFLCSSLQAKILYLIQILDMLPIKTRLHIDAYYQRYVATYPTCSDIMWFIACPSGISIIGSIEDLDL